MGDTSGWILITEGSLRLHFALLEIGLPALLFVLLAAIFWALAR